MTKILLLIVLGLAAILSPLRADDITLTDGTVLKNAKIVQRDDSTKTVTISFSGGITQVHSEMLPATPVTAPSPTTPNAANTSTPVSGPATAPSPTLPSLQQNASDYNAQGFDKYTKGDFDGAIADFNQAIALDPKLAEAYNRRGNANRAKGNTDAAIADYQQAIVINPKYANPRNNLGNLKVEKGDLDGAIADYNQAIALDPKLAQAYNNRGIAKRDKGDLDDAISDFKQAIALDPKFIPHPPPDYDPVQEEQSFINLERKNFPRIGETISSFQLKGDTLVVTMTDGFNSSSYQSRLELAQAFYQLWATYHNDKAQSYVSPLCMIDARGTQVGGMNASGIWVKPTQKEANALVGLTEQQVRSKFGQPIRVEKHDSPDGPFEQLVINDSKGTETFFMIFEKDGTFDGVFYPGGTVASGCYRGLDFPAKTPDEIVADKAKPADPKTESKEFIQKLASMGVDNTIVKSVSVQGDRLTIVVTEYFHAAPYQTRLQVAQNFEKLWLAIHGDPYRDGVSPFSITDYNGNEVGGTGMFGVWVQKEQ